MNRATEQKRGIVGCWGADVGQTGASGEFGDGG